MAHPNAAEDDFLTWLEHDDAEPHVPRDLKQAVRLYLRTITDERDEAELSVTRLRQFLLEYGRHSEGCNAQWGDTYRCRCGWREVEAEFTQASGTYDEQANAGDG